MAVLAAVALPRAPRRRLVTAPPTTRLKLVPCRDEPPPPFLFLCRTRRHDAAPIRQGEVTSACCLAPLTLP